MLLTFEERPAFRRCTKGARENAEEAVLEEANIAERREGLKAALGVL